MIPFPVVRGEGGRDRQLPVAWHGSATAQLPTRRLLSQRMQQSTVLLGASNNEVWAADLAACRCASCHLWGELLSTRIRQHLQRAFSACSPVVSASELETCFRQPAAFRGVAKHVIHRLCHVFDGVWVEILQHSSRDFGKA